MPQADPVAEPLAPGLYERLMTTSLTASVAELGERASTGAIDPADEAHVLARHVYEVALRTLAGARTTEERLHLTNTLLQALPAVPDEVGIPPAQLQSVRSPAAAPGLRLVRPATPLGSAALLTNTRDEPNLGSELKAEIESSDRVDLLCAFVKWHGLRLLEGELTRRQDRDAPLRVITTTYMGATERAALDRLINDFGAEVKIQYDSQRTRLHAKAWMFHRNTGYDTAYVGSSNLSRAALLDGLEWNVRLSRVETPSLLDKFDATFDAYWNDPTFETYHPARDRDRLDDALAEASGRTHHDRVTLSLSGLEVRPYPYQQRMLDAIEAERIVHDRHRNLVVAATGTGKTVLAALDYRRLNIGGEQPSLLFVAHRREILEQALRTYREVLMDADFGELYVAGLRPERWRHVFASVQSLAGTVQDIPADAFSIVVIDEFHHAQAPTYRRLLDHLEPRELLGLTATPERADGLDVRDFFDGRTATELRLWDALGAELLCPFHYFALADGTDLRQIEWTRGRYDDAQLDNVYTGNRARAGIVLRELADKVLDLRSMRGLGFCVSVAHAEFMAQVFTEAGIPSRAVSGATSADLRAQSLTDLREKRLNMLFAADLFNEGLDLPDVDTVLFLRPTESATIFLQQLGRGLRRTRDKAVLTVLDFVGHQRKEFRFDEKLRALTGQSRRGLERDIEREFPFLPAGCQIVMDRQSQQLVLDNIRTQVGNRWSSMVTELRRSGDVDLSTYLYESRLELSDVLRRGTHSWTRLRRDAGLETATGGDHEDRLLRRARAFAHVDDQVRGTHYAALLSDDAPTYGDLSPVEQQLAEMLFFSLWPDGGGFTSIDEGMAQLRHEHAARAEVRAVVEIGFDTARHQAPALTGRLALVPLRVHARYQREEVLAALGYASLSRKPNSFREGVLYVPELNVDAFFVTLKKSEADYSPTTMYRDYPISRDLFHWESQSVTSVASPTGQRYVNRTSQVLLFVRHEQKDDFGTSPYLFAGPMTYVSHQGERPIALTWRMAHALPSDFYNAAAVIAQ